ncbi:MAG TPA: 1-(5-phosphoribosyl)-5-[(5-phosphoribosylamino)methylideneamino]imidazole-4-carboxamide isomerase [Candidatus Binataceae bacterium]|nr:1-(5-phosphoribosyl)-5-[(5-phosphoribosylamino)methylideneamino]imidazole-4-carboxamide isomerase [Candidatus Binataceae bacterium]
MDKFTVIPSIDIKGGEVVRLLRGEMARATVYGSDPAEAARKFAEQGAELIHVVDLDGAIAGAPRNLDAVRAIRAAVRCALDVAGGLRTIENVREAFAAGADQVSIGSAAFLSPDLVRSACREFPGRVGGSIDARGGRLAIKGWVETSPLTVERAAAIFKDAGVAVVTVTDIARDGAETGVDASRMGQLARKVGVPLIASGGVARLDDIAALRERFDDGVVGVIVGRALYEGRFTLAQAFAIARK